MPKTMTLNIRQLPYKIPQQTIQATMKKKKKQNPFAARAVNKHNRKIQKEVSRINHSRKWSLSILADHH